MSEVCNLKMALSMLSLIRVHSIQFFVVMDLHPMLNRCLMKFIEFCQQTVFTFALLMVYLRADFHSFRRKIMSGLSSSTRLPSLPSLHLMLLTMKSRMTRTSTLSLLCARLKHLRQPAQKVPKNEIIYINSHSRNNKFSKYRIGHSVIAFNQKFLNIALFCF